MNNVKIKKFLGMEVRIVNEEYIVLKDVFSALGRLDNKNQIVSTDRNKLKEFLIDINAFSRIDQADYTIYGPYTPTQIDLYQKILKRGFKLWDFIIQNQKQYFCQ